MIVLGIQLGLAAFSFALAGRKLHGLLVRHRVDEALFMARATSGSLDELRALSNAFPDAYLGWMAAAVAEADEHGLRRSDALDEAIAEARHHAIADVRTIRGLATIASAVGLIAAMVHHFSVRYGSLPVSELAFGVAQARAAREATIAIAIGLATAGVLHVGSRVLRREAHACLAEIARAAKGLSRAFCASEDEVAREPGDPTEN